MSSPNYIDLLCFFHIQNLIVVNGHIPYYIQRQETKTKVKKPN